MMSLLEDWPILAERLHRAPSLALFLDFDGTLAPIVKNPNEAAMNRIARAALLRLAVNPRVHTWLISGRRERDLRELVGAIPGLTYLGVHGGDVSGGNVSGGKATKAVARTVSEALRELAAGMNGKSGVLIEDKGVAFSVHHRNAHSAEVARTRKLLDEVISRTGGALRIVPGDRVWEVLPREICGKGDAARRQWRLRSPEALPIYIGNDGTDEAAFAALASGITARVGAARPTRARYALRDPAEVARFLQRLEEETRWKNGPAFSS